jgi:hypothetical protein
MLYKQVGNSAHYGYKMYLRNGREIIYIPHNVSDRLNYFLLKMYMFYPT